MIFYSKTMPEALKESLFPRSFFVSLGKSIEAEIPSIKTESFLNLIYNETWENLELKERMTHTAKILAQLLPKDYLLALKIVLRMAEPLQQTGFAGMILSEFVALYGLDFPEESLVALERFTKIASAEFAIRPFILNHPDRVHKQMLFWSQNSDPAVRRLSTEGYRPRLPWGLGIPALKKDPSPVLQILENLKDDPDEVVRRSVANNLNDIGKDKPEIMLRVLETWHQESLNLTNEKRANRQALIKHALRSLIKKGEPRALSLIGIKQGAELKILNFTASSHEVRQGETVRFSLTLFSISEETQDILIDYALHFVRAKGKSNAKVFKGQRTLLKPKETFNASFSFSFREITTRRYYPGKHRAEVLVNGLARATCEFELV